MLIALWAFAGSECLANATGQSAASPKGVECGPNAALMFLVICGMDVDDRAIGGIGLSTAGVSMLQLRDFCDSQGVPAEVRKFRADEVESMPLPAIWQSRQNVQHHYFVVYGIDESGIYALDGTTGEKLRFKQERIGNFFTGYALVPKQSLVGHLMAQISTDSVLVWLLMGLNIALLGGLVVQRRMGR